MEAFLSLINQFFTGVFAFFQIQVPIIGISFWQLFAGMIILKAFFVAIKIIFGIDHGKDSI